MLTVQVRLSSLSEMGRDVQRHSVPKCPPTLLFAWGFEKLRGPDSTRSKNFLELFFQLREYFADTAAFNITQSGRAIPRLQLINV